MRPGHLTILLALLAAALLPRAAHAQYSTCTDFACDSYGAYDPYSHEISGYSRTVDYLWGWYLQTFSSIQAPDGEGETTVATNQAEGYWEAEADVYYAPGQTGQFSIDGDHQYELEDNEMDDGQSFYPVDVEPPPPLFTPCPGPWYPGTNNVSVSGSGFTGQAVSIYGNGVDSNTLSVMSDTLIQGSVQVNSGIVSQTFVALIVGDGACTVALEPSPTTLLSNGSLSGAVQDWSDNGDGTFTVSLSPLAWDGMMDNGFLGEEAALAGIFIPGVGEVELVVGVVVGGAAVVALAHWWINHKNDAPPKIPRPARGVPTGTIPIDQMGWSRDKIHAVKDGVVVGNADWVGIAPNGDVITGSVTGDAENHGPWSQFTNL